MTPDRATRSASPDDFVAPKAAHPEHEQAWRELMDVSSEPNVFAGPEMIGAAAGSVAPDDWQIAVAGSGDRFEAVAPFRTMRAVPLIGPPVIETFWSDFGPVGTPLLRNASPALVGRLIDVLGRCGSVVRMRYQRLDGPFVAALTAATEQRGIALEVTDVHERAQLVSSTDPEEALGPALKSKRRKELARLHRRLGDHGPVSHAVATAPSDVTAALEDYIRIEHAGWKGEGGSSFAAEETRRRFARAFVSARAAAGAVRIDTLSVAEKPIASLITHRTGDTAYLWKIAYDEAFAAYSPGVQIVRLATEDFLADPTLQNVDSLATADHPMINRLWAGRLRMGTLIFATTASANRQAARVTAIHDAHVRLRAAARSLRDRIRR
ncbi:GNAT family N-acetyltransferase [Chthonobacter albigriseus]|uniref:GNAT family N-acetyltransferase n=1 Tax=Chthonobacter albigriseus TaxID=1683161 RepID=UPI0015EFD331|nr:GNAT family N-acetyltransferase [Chthonobacter albigriseus]